MSLEKGQKLRPFCTLSVFWASAPALAFLISCAVNNPIREKAD